MTTTINPFEIDTQRNQDDIVVSISFSKAEKGYFVSSVDQDRGDKDASYCVTLPFHCYLNDFLVLRKAVDDETGLHVDLSALLDEITINIVALIDPENDMTPEIVESALRGRFSSNVESADEQAKQDEYESNGR